MVDGGAPPVPHRDVEQLAPLIARWAATHGRTLSDGALLTRAALEGDVDARCAFEPASIEVLDRTGDAHAFLLAATAVDAADEVAAGTPARRPLARAGNLLVQGVAVVVAAFLVFIAYGAYVDNRWYKIVEIRGISMEPTIHNGDAIVLTRPPSRIEVGMIVTLEVEGQIVTHRVVEVRDDGTFVTKGDANTHADDFTGLDVRVVGVYRARIPEVGAWLTL
jgi:signal peptidase I